MPTETRGIFSFNYEDYGMKCATIQGRELNTFLLTIISSNDKPAMEFFTDQIFTLINQFDIDKLYGLSIALTNYYFEIFWFAAWMDIQKGMTKRGEEILIWACENAWKQDKAKNYNFHKGTPYFFLGRCYIMNGNFDLGFQMVHLGHIENLVVYPKLNLIYPKLNLDYRDAPSYLFMTLKNIKDNALYDYVLIMKNKLEKFIRAHNDLAPYPISYEIFDEKFLYHVSRDFDEAKFVLVYLLMNLINLDKYDRKPLNQNSFSNLKKIELMRSLCLIVDKTLGETYGTDGIDAGVFKYLKDKLSIGETEIDKFYNAISYSDKSSFKMREHAERITRAILSNELRYNQIELSYSMKCMILVWRLRNFSAHNLSGINQLLTDSYHSILSMLFSALFFAAEIL